jgi:hypothetical protein
MGEAHPNVWGGICPGAGRPYRGGGCSVCGLLERRLLCIEGCIAQIGDQSLLTELWWHTMSSVNLILSLITLFRLVGNCITTTDLERQLRQWTRTPILGRVLCVP